MKRIIQFDLLRCVACFFIVLLHVSSSYLAGDPYGNYFTVMTAYNSMTRFAVPVFIMLSGCFLLEPTKEETIITTVKRFFKTFVIFYVWSAFYAFQSVIFHFIKGKEYVTEAMIDAAIERFFYGHYHMWFLLLIMGFYLVVPMLRKVCGDLQVLQYYIGLWILLRFVLPLFSGLEVVNMLIVKMDIYLVFGYVGYFLLGYYLRCIDISKKSRYIIYACGILGFLFTFFKTIYASRINNELIETYFSPSSLNVLLMSVAVFVFFKNINISFGDISIKLIKKLSKCALVVYLVHPFFLEKLNLIGITTISFHPIISVPILTLLIYLASNFVALCIEKVVNMFNKS